MKQQMAEAILLAEQDLSSWLKGLETELSRNESAALAIVTIQLFKDSWQVLVLLADYFCMGNYQQTPKLQYSALSDYREVYLTEFRRAMSGTEWLLCIIS